MLHNRACSYCGALFKPVRKGHLFCKETCRKLAFKAKNRAKTLSKQKRRISEKLKRLSSSAFGLYLVKEIRRAGTVEVLFGHTAVSLGGLSSLRRRCTASGGYKEGECLGYYELSHIYPVSGKDRLGLLTPANLAITPHKFNRKHGTKTPVKGYLGESIPRSQLNKIWNVKDKLDSLSVLKLARKYIGDEFDIWLKKHLISQTQKQSILKKFKEAGYDNDVLSSMSLSQLKAMANEKEIPYFSINSAADDELLIVWEELQRLNINNKVVEQLNEYAELYFNFSDSTFIGSEQEETEFKDYLVQQAYLCIHGQEFLETWIDKPFDYYFKRYEIESNQTAQDDDYDDIL